jgi:prolyl 4-hydroxylase
MNKLYIIVVLLLIVFLLIRYLQINEYGDNKELFTSDIADVSLPINNIDNFGLKKLNDTPQILLIDNFLTTEECDHIVKVGDPMVKQSEVCGKSGSRPDKSRTSWTAHIGKQLITKDKKDPILMNIYEKAGKFCNRSSKNIEPIQLVRYTPGQFFKSHYDYLDTRVPMYKKNVEKNGQREVTFFVYLNDVPDGVGGETHFKKINKTFKGKKGQAVFWYNMRDGKVDPLTLHSGTEIKEGTKYGLNIWVRDKEYKG